MKPDSKLLELHRSRKPEMIQVARECAAELEQVYKKYYSKLCMSYSMAITTINRNEPELPPEGVKFSQFCSLMLLDSYYPDPGKSFIDLNDLIVEG